MNKAIDQKTFYLTKQVITYLGNKRKLIPFIDKAVEEIIANDKTLSKKQPEEITFFDIFAGSGVVSRYARLKGFKTLSNDLEVYSKVINEAFLCFVEDDFQSVFKKVRTALSKDFTITKTDDAYADVLLFLNNQKEPQDSKDSYFSLHYAPKDTKNPDFNNERLFYTQENARKIDAIVAIIFNKRYFSEDAKKIILASLMYNMTIHINTSGTMKGFHNGWGGQGKVALDRILSDINLEKLPACNNIKGDVYSDYAEKVFTNHSIPSVDIIYADPPYNQHQYSANYNHLTTVALNDKYDPGEVIQGSRAGIRTDHNRSDFCKSKKDENSHIKQAELAFIDFMNNVRCKYMIMSYNNEGVVAIDRLLDLISQGLKNTVSFKHKVYDKYKGGKTTQTSNKVVEYLLVIEMDKLQSREDFEIVKSNLSQLTADHLLSDRYINYKLLKHVIDGEQAVIYDDYDEKVMTVDKSTYRVQDDFLNGYSNKESLDAILKHEMTTTDLMEAYIYDNNKKLAIKTLSAFNIKKLKDIRKGFIERIALLKG